MLWLLGSIPHRPSAVLVGPGAAGVTARFAGAGAEEVFASHAPAIE